MINKLIKSDSDWKLDVVINEESKFKSLINFLIGNKNFDFQVIVCSEFEDDEDGDEDIYWNIIVESAWFANLKLISDFLAQNEFKV